MKLSANQQKIVIEIVNRKWGGGRLCPFCQTPSGWTLEPEILEMRPYNAGNLSIGGLVWPYVVTSCNNCGYSAAFSAVKLGVVKKESGELSVVAPTS